MTRLLLIEDEDSLRDSLADLLEAEGYQVLLAENGLQGVQLANEHLPALIICDMMMPLLDGHEVFQRLRAVTATAGIPFIFLTARADRFDDLPEATAYITKPFTRARLLAAIQANLDDAADAHQ